VVPKVWQSRLFGKSIFHCRSVNHAVSNVEGLKLKITAHKTVTNNFDQIRAGIKSIYRQNTMYFRDQLRCIPTDKHAAFDGQLEHVLFFTLQCKRMYFQSGKLIAISYFGPRFIHSLA